MSCSKSPSPNGNCKSVSASHVSESLADLVMIYKKKHDLHRCWKRKLTIPEAVFGDPTIYTKMPTLSDKLTKNEWKDFLSKVKPHPHQYPIPYDKDKLREIAEYLAEHWNRDSFKDFEDLYDYICSLLVKSPVIPNGKVKTPNALILYDIALRLAYRYGVWPEKYVYLNGSGPSEAVHTLGLDKYVHQTRILYSDIINKYPELAELDAAQLEDFLCIFRKQFNR